MIEKLKLFERTCFSFLIGNEDMHLKNFFIITRDDIIELSSAYDMVNSTIVLPNPKEEMALPIRGRKHNLTRNDMVSYFAQDVLSLTKQACNSSLEKINSSFIS